MEKQNNITNLNQIKLEIEEISKFCKLKIHGLLNPKIETSSVKSNFKYDILKWIANYDEKNWLSLINLIIMKLNGVIVISGEKKSMFLIMN